MLVVFWHRGWETWALLPVYCCYGTTSYQMLAIRDYLKCKYAHKWIKLLLAKSWAFLMSSLHRITVNQSIIEIFDNWFLFLSGYFKLLHQINKKLEKNYHMKHILLLVCCVIYVFQSKYSQFGNLMKLSKTKISKTMQLQFHCFIYLCVANIIANQQQKNYRFSMKCS